MVYGRITRYGGKEACTINRYSTCTFKFVLLKFLRVDQINQPFLKVFYYYIKKCFVFVCFQAFWFLPLGPLHCFLPPSDLSSLLCAVCILTDSES